MEASMPRAGLLWRSTFPSLIQMPQVNTRAVYVSGGSACDKGEPSHTLLAMGCADLTVRTALRVSFCADNTAEDVDALLTGLRDGLQELQHI